MGDERRPGDTETATSELEAALARLDDFVCGCDPDGNAEAYEEELVLRALAEAEAVSPAGSIASDESSPDSHRAASRCTRGRPVRTK